jgi:hypothetical protein
MAHLSAHATRLDTILLFFTGMPGYGIVVHFVYHTWWTGVRTAAPADNPPWAAHLARQSPGRTSAVGDDP